jgi:hypothetical protein
MKHEWRKHEKEIYLPPTKPVIIDVPEFKYFTIEGAGDPNSANFAEYIGVLYSLSYAVKMSYKKGIEPKGYFAYTVYPLEGVWDLRPEAQKRQAGFDKKDLIYKLMIRQPDFVERDFAEQIIALTQEKKPHALLSTIKFETIGEGKCLQMLHLGSYDNEQESFRIMEDFAMAQGLRRISRVHKEIYLNDARKTAAEKLKTVLRFQIAAGK